jgi:hypothetical protein
MADSQNRQTKTACPSLTFEHVHSSVGQVSFKTPAVQFRPLCPDWHHCRVVECR